MKRRLVGVNWFGRQEQLMKAVVHPVRHHQLRDAGLAKLIARAVMGRAMCRAQKIATIVMERGVVREVLLALIAQAPARSMDLSLAVSAMATVPRGLRVVSRRIRWLVLIAVAGNLLISASVQPHAGGALGKGMCHVSSAATMDECLSGATAVVDWGVFRLKLIVGVAMAPDRFLAGCLVRIVATGEYHAERFAQHLGV